MLRMSFAALALGAAIVAQPTPAAVPMAVFDPVAFFTGTTEGVGQLKQAFAATHRTRTRSVGKVQGATLVLDQTVEEEDTPLRSRHWRLRQVSPGHFRGTISDAIGPVSADVAGPRMTVRYSMKGGLKVALTITVAPGGQSARNAMKVTKFGLTVATLDETIRRI